jgi:FkbM family methyltransferase
MTISAKLNPARLRFAVALWAGRVMEYANRGLSDADRRWLGMKLLHGKLQSKGFAKLIEYCNDAWNNADADITRNGEKELLRRLARFGPTVVFDVGANVGDWSEAALGEMPTATVYAFEIVPDTYGYLELRLAPHVGRAMVNPFGLGATASNITIHTKRGFSQRASIVRDALLVGMPPAEATAEPEEISAHIRTGDAYMKANGITHIDLLKIDVEGGELDVLHGFQSALKAGVIAVVQFEYGLINLITRTFLQDFYELLGRHGYVLGKMFPDGVRFADYSYQSEDFLLSSYVACRRDRPDIRELIGAASQPPRQQPG